MQTKLELNGKTYRVICKEQSPQFSWLWTQAKSRSPLNRFDILHSNQIINFNSFTNGLQDLYVIKSYLEYKFSDYMQYHLVETNGALTSKFIKKKSDIHNYFITNYPNITEFKIQIGPKEDFITIPLAKLEKIFSYISSLEVNIGSSSILPPNIEDNEAILEKISQINYVISLIPVKPLALLTNIQKIDHKEKESINVESPSKENSDVLAEIKNFISQEFKNNELKTKNMITEVVKGLAQNFEKDASLLKQEISNINSELKKQANQNNATNNQIMQKIDKLEENFSKSIDQKLSVLAKIQENYHQSLENSLNQMKSQVSANVNPPQSQTEANVPSQKKNLKKQLSTIDEALDESKQSSSTEIKKQPCDAKYLTSYNLIDRLRGKDGFLAVWQFYPSAAKNTENMVKRAYLSNSEFSSENALQNEVVKAEQSIIFVDSECSSDDQKDIKSEKKYKIPIKDKTIKTFELIIQENIVKFCINYDGLYSSKVFQCWVEPNKGAKKQVEINLEPKLKVVEGKLKFEKSDVIGPSFSITYSFNGAWERYQIENSKITKIS